MDLDAALPDTDALEVWEHVDQTLRRERMRTELELLSVDQRQVIELAYYGGRTLQQIADETQAPLGTIKSRLRLGLDKLRQALRDIAEGNGGS